MSCKKLTPTTAIYTIFCELIKFLLFFFLLSGITGAIIKIDGKGDSEGNFSVLALQPYHSNEPLAANFSCNYLMTPVAHFQQANDFPVSELSFSCLNLYDFNVYVGRKLSGVVFCQRIILEEIA